MKIVLTGGCTGGHIYPALAIGDKFREKDSNNEVIYIGYENGLETSIVPKEGYELKCVNCQWIRRDNPIKMIKTVAGTLKGRKQAIEIMKEFKPDVVVSTGSFVSVPSVLAARALKIPYYMHEQNGFPGVSNKMWASGAKKVFLGFEAARQYFKDDSNVMYSGNPVRKDFYNRDMKADRAALNISDKDTVITVFGGSLGSATTNEIGEAVIREFGGKKGYTVIFGTGKMYNEAVMAKLKEDGLADFDNVRVNAYISDMPSVLSASDLVVSRAGALSVAEVTMSNVAAIFVPSPNVTADHQYHNAKAVADVGGAIIVRENEQTAAKVLEEMVKLVNDKDAMEKMKKASLTVAPYEAADIIYNTIMETYR